MYKYFQIKPLGPRKGLHHGVDDDDSQGGGWIALGSVCAGG